MSIPVVVWKREGSKLVESARNSFFALLALAFLVAIPVGLRAAGQIEDPEAVAIRLARIARDIESEKSQADRKIDDQDYDSAVEDLVRIVEFDDNELPAIERRFTTIRDARRAYVERGREVERELRALLDEDIPPEEVVPRAIQALASIAAMREIIPNPNPEDAALIAELQFRVQLTIDQRRFNALMELAAEAFREGEYVEAVRIYVDGPAEETITLTDEQRSLIRLESGLDLQRGLFEAIRSGIERDLMTNAREQVRSFALAATALEGSAPPPGDATSFEVVAPEALARAEVMTASFSAGDFADAEQRIAEYLPQLRSISAIYQEINDAAQIIARQEEINAQLLQTDPGYAYDWHTRFVSDLVLGRRSSRGERVAEGILTVIGSVRDLVADEPVAAAQEFARTNYERAVSELLGFAWDSVRAPVDDTRVSEHARSTDRLLEAVALSSRTAIEVLNTAGALGIDVPDQTDSSDPPELAARVWSGFFDQLGGREPSSETETLEIAAIRTASAEQLSSVLARAELAYRAATPFASQSAVPPLIAQRSTLQTPLEEIRGGLSAWPILPATPRDAQTPLHAAYLNARIDRVERYDTDVADLVATIELREFQTRLSRMQSTVTAARTDLNATVQVAGLTIQRPRAGEARDRLRPLVGSIAGTRVTNVATGELDGLRRQTLALIERLDAEQAHVRDDTRVRAHLENATRIVQTIGSTQTGLIATAVSLAEQALGRVARAQELDRSGRDRLVEVENEILSAEAANRAGNIESASELLGRATLLLSSENPAILDASDLFTESLANWYRASVEQFWNSERERINALIIAAQKSIVFTRVDQIVDDARPLVESQQWLAALDILEEGLRIWENVFPTQQNPSLTALLRLARTAYSQESEQVLREDLPGFSRLSQILNTAFGAYEDGSYATAEQALGLFFTEQPLNFQARLLEVRLALARASDAPDRVVQNLVDGALNDASVTRNELGSRTIDDDQFDGLLELESRLSAILEVVRAVSGVTRATIASIEQLITQIDPILRPPVVVPTPPPNIRAEADRRIAQAEAFGDWLRLPTNQVEEVLSLLNEALEIYPGYDRALTLVQRALSLPNAPTRTSVDAQGQAVINQALQLSQQGRFDEALTLLERYLAVNPNAVRDLDFKNLYDSLRRRQRAG